MYSVICVIMYLSFFALREECLCHARVYQESAISTLDPAGFASDSSSATSETYKGYRRKDREEQARIDKNNNQFQKDRSTLSELAHHMQLGLSSNFLSKKYIMNELDLENGGQKMKLKPAVYQLDHVYHIQTDILGKNEHAIEFDMKFGFKEVYIKSKFSYETTFLMTSVIESGEVTLELSGSCIVSVHGSVPVDIQPKATKDLTTGQCPLTVRGVKVNEVPEDFKVKEGTSIFDTFTKNQLYAGSVIKLLKRSSAKFVPLLKDVLQKQVEVAIRGDMVGCKFEVSHPKELHG